MNPPGKQLIESLLQPDVYPHAVNKPKLVETHISWVILTGPFAYKIKKPVNLGFLDFSTLEKRKHYCEEEVRLNSRLAPDTYLDVITINGSTDKPVLGGKGPAIEYAVKMRQFNPDDELDKVLERGELKTEHMYLLAEKVSSFHSEIAIAQSDSTFGTPESILEPCIENLDQIKAIEFDTLITRQLGIIRQWTLDTWKTLIPVFLQRKREGFIKECHGDLHLHNMALADKDILIFDCIEFNPNLYWIDVFNEIAFTVMDLDDHDHSDLGSAFLNRYLEITGDYEGLQVLRFYRVYRAMVRAKVACIRLQQEQNSTLPGTAENEFRQYQSLALRYIQIETPHLFITHGLSGSGKTTVARKLALEAEVIHIRSDIERKRLFDLHETERSDSAVNAGIYTESASDRTYQHLADITRLVLESGYSIIVDAAFLDRKKRANFRKIATELAIPFHILDCSATEQELRQRLVARNREGTDASEANPDILDYQLQHTEKLDKAESQLAITVDTEKSIDTVSILLRAKQDLPASN
jgi:aminoglycoside phosphotransferase family enzyme/predicted kinase